MNNQIKKEQPCWTCTKYIKGCSWSERLEPVEGWIAEKRKYPSYSNTYIIDGRQYVIHRNRNSYTYEIQYCPEYEKEPERKQEERDK